MTLAHLHSHSEFSARDGICSVKDMLEHCTQIGCSALALTDHGALAGHRDLYMVESNVKKIYGYEGYYWNDKYHDNRKKNYHLTMWAKNTNGLKNLWKMATIASIRANEAGYSSVFITDDIMREYGKDIIGGSACLGGGIPQLIKNNRIEEAEELLNVYKECFDEFYIEIHTNTMDEQREVNLELIKFAKRTETPIIYSIDAHYLRQEDAKTQEALMQSGFKRTISHKNEYQPVNDYYLMTEEDVKKKLDYIGNDAINDCFAGVDKFLASVSDDIVFDDERKIPQPSGVDCSDGLLVKMCKEGMTRKVGNGIELDRVEFAEYYERINYELGVIINNGLTNYFLTVADYTKWAKSDDGGAMLVGSGRGSAGGSLLCYLLDITEVDPIKNGLYFERFLNEGRLTQYEVEFEDGTKMTGSATTTLTKPDGTLVYLRNLEYGEEVIV